MLLSVYSQGEENATALAEFDKKYGCDPSPKHVMLSICHGILHSLFPVHARIAGVVQCSPPFRYGAGRGPSERDS